MNHATLRSSRVQPPRDKGKFGGVQPRGIGRLHGTGGRRVQRGELYFSCKHVEDIDCGCAVPPTHSHHAGRWLRIRRLLEPRRARSRVQGLAGRAAIGLWVHHDRGVWAGRSRGHGTEARAGTAFQCWNDAAAPAAAGRLWQLDLRAARRHGCACSQTSAPSERGRCPYEEVCF